MRRCYDVPMRTTLNLGDDIVAAARVLAAERDMSLGEAVSELARRGLRPRDTPTRNGLPVFEVVDGAPPITPEMVREAADET